MTLRYKCTINNGRTVGTFDGLFADDAAMKGFARIIKVENISNDIPVDFTIKCEDGRDKNHYFFTGTRVHGRNSIELKYIFTNKLFIVDYIEEIRDDEYDGEGFLVVNKNTTTNSNITDFSYVLLEI